MMDVGTRLARARKRSGLTRVRLAELSGVRYETIRAIEQGRNLPSLSNLCKLCGALRINANDVIPSYMYEVKR